MESGKNKATLVNILIAILSCILVVIVHDFGHDWYMDHFTSRSKGVTLGFIMAYMRYIMIPAIFLSAFIRVKYSITILSVFIIFMFYCWYESNPLRVILMFVSCLSGYTLIIFYRLLKNKNE